jgi:CheY-like chemotaxis protein/signal transduction histidine kinase/CHASE3 domain sensor protein
MLRRAEHSSAFRSLVRRTLVLPLVLLALLSAGVVAEILHLAQLHRAVDRTDQVISHANAVQKLYLDAETGVRGFLLTRVPEFLEPYESSRRALPSALTTLRALVVDNPRQVARVDAIASRGEAWLRTAERRLDEARRGQALVLRESVEGKELMDGIRELVHEFIAAEEGLRLTRSHDVESSSELALWLTVIATLSLGAVLSVLGRRQLVALSGRYEQALADQLRQTEELQRQEWVSRGRARVGDEVRGELDEPQVARRLLDALAEYVEATVGALYAVGEGRDRLELRAVLGCGGAGEAAPPPSIPLEATWVGQVARGRRVVRLAELPPEHVRVATATGTSSPRELVLAPLVAEDEVIAVVELGFLHPCEDRVLEFLAAAAEPGGFALRSARYRAHLAQLLAATQRQAHDLQQQQEELRVANEELEEQSQALQKSQARLEEQQEELRVSNARLADQASTLELQRDNLEDAQAALVEKAEQLARASRYKSEFLANMSHELRTPLNSSLILAKLLADNKDGNLTPQQVQFAETIHAAGNDLLELINDILDLSRIEAGRMEVKPEPVAVAGVLESLDRSFRPLADEKGLALTLSRDPGAAETLETDPQRLQQILKNLLSNALKFTERGEVSVRVAASGPERIAFVIRDTGIGISREDQEWIFEAFRQVDGSAHRQHGGTGLGLTISRDLARRLGGDVFVESVPGEGATFSLVLPVTVPAEAPSRSPLRAPPPTSGSPPSLSPAAGEGRGDGEAPGADRAAPRARRNGAPAPPSRGRGAAAATPPAAAADDRDVDPPGARTLLVVEDDPRFAGILQDLAHELRFRCLVATTAAEALELARRHRPGGIVLDVNLPDGSGLGVLEVLKRGPDTRHIPVHVVSVADYTQRALEMGAIGYALKPVQREQLVEAFRKLDEKAQQRTRRVLVVEDAAAQRDALHHLLESDGVEIVAVGTAQEALRELAARTFDCMVLDLGLPDMSGYELLERMSADGAFSFPPVIVYTGRALSPAEELQLRRYSKSVVIKGARSPERLLDEVTLFIHRVEATLPREQQRLLREARNRDAVLEGRRVLLVEDDVRNVFALTSALEGKGAKAQVARNGREALDALARAGDGEGRIDLVLMDLMMPVMDGLTAIREIRGNDGWKKLPIIALTAKAMPEDRESCLAAGANDYIPKPLDLDRLMSLIRVWMPR